MKKGLFLIFFGICVAMLLIPTYANAGTFIGTYCFQLTNYFDMFIWNVEAVGEGSFITYTVSGMNTSNGRGMSGGGSVVGSEIRLFVGETAANSSYAGQLHSVVLDLTSFDMAGTDDIILHTIDGNHVILPGEPLSLVLCP
jgi:hypothetical protein